MLQTSGDTFDFFLLECSVIWLFVCCLYLATWLGAWLANSTRMFAFRLAIDDGELLLLRSY